MKKNTIVEILTLIVVFVLAALAIYFYPNLKVLKEEKRMEKIKSSIEIFTTKIIAEHENNKAIVVSAIVQKVVDELNAAEKNPYGSKDMAYSFDVNCKACNSVQYDDDLGMVMITSYNKQGDLMARTVIKPPSFVTYFKEIEKQGAKPKEKSESKTEITPAQSN